MVESHVKLKLRTIERKVNRYESEWEDFMKDMKDSITSLIASQFNRTIGVFAVTASNEDFRDQSIRYFNILNTLGVANFKSAMKPDETFCINLDGESIELTGEETTAYMHTTIWIDAFCVAVIARDMEGIRTLCQMPESAHATANIQPDVFDLRFVEMLKGLFNPEANIAQLIVNAMQAAEVEASNADKEVYKSHILWPMFPLMRCILQTEAEAEFNEKLEAALIEHKEYWQHSERDFTPSGWVSLPLTAMCVLAADNKRYKVAIKTDYIPEWLVKQNFEV